MRWIDHLKSFGSLTAITLDLAFWLMPIIVIGLVKLIVPGAQRRCAALLDAIYRAAVAFDDFWLERVVGLRWRRPDLVIDENEVCIVLSNHASWADILLLQSAICREGPLLKFLSKQELVWVPIFGVIFWAFDMPRLRRRSKAGHDDEARKAADAAALRSACEVVRRHPAALMNFAEGTRFDPEKRARTESPFRTLLRPRVGGLHALLEALDGSVQSVVDVTIVYPEGTTFWRLLAGLVPHVEVYAERIPIDRVPRDREALSEWLMERWRWKDARILAARESMSGALEDR